MQELAGHSQLGHLILLLGIYDFTEYHLKQDYAETMTKEGKASPLRSVV